MAAAQYDITIEQGSTFSLPLTFNQDGMAIDVSGWTFEGQVRSSYSSLTIISSFLFQYGIATNQVSANLTAQQTASIPVSPSTNYPISPTLYCYDIIATLPNGSILRIMEGSTIVVPSVTR